MSKKNNPRERRLQEKKKEESLKIREQSLKKRVTSNIYQGREVRKVKGWGQMSVKPLGLIICGPSIPLTEPLSEVMG